MGIRIHCATLVLSSGLSLKFQHVACIILVLTGALTESVNKENRTDIWEIPYYLQKRFALSTLRTVKFTVCMHIAIDLLSYNHSSMQFLQTKRFRIWTQPHLTNRPSPPFRAFSRG